MEEVIYAPASFDAVHDHLSEDAQAVEDEIERRLKSDNSAGNIVTALLRSEDADPGADRVFQTGDLVSDFGGGGSDERLSARVLGPRDVLDPTDRNEVSAILWGPNPNFPLRQRDRTHESVLRGCRGVPVDTASLRFGRVAT